MEIISGLDSLKKVLQEAGRIKLYGAGLKLASFMEAVVETGMPFQAECILVSSARGNPDHVFGLPIVEVSKASFREDDVILLTLSSRFTEDALRMLSGRGVREHIYGLDYRMIDSVPYEKVHSAMKPFLDACPDTFGGWNAPVEAEKKYVWSCWWQGEKQAPELVKKCWESQKRYLPKDAEHVILTWETFRDYIELPEFITEKAKKGTLLLAHLSDIARCCLLYRYGGIWLDATVCLTDRIPEEYFLYETMTRSTGEKIYGTDVSWVTWFLGGKKGGKLYRFLMEAFFWYLKNHDGLFHYYMIDFLIAVACRELPGVEETFRKIPVNNGNADRLQRHLSEAFDQELYRACTEGGCMHKLTHKGSGYGENSFYRYIMDKDFSA